MVWDQELWRADGTAFAEECFPPPEIGCLRPGTVVRTRVAVAHATAYRLVGGDVRLFFPRSPAAAVSKGCAPGDGSEVPVANRALRAFRLPRWGGRACVEGNCAEE